jgi:hypothetical protein
VGGSLHFNSATNSSFIGPSSTTNIRYGADGIHQFDTYSGSWGTRAQITDTNLNLGSNVGFQLNGTTVITSAREIQNVTFASALYTDEYGKSLVGNFGQFQAHSAYSTGFNASVAMWGWNYVQSSTNAPNANSNQWYRNRVSLGDAYGYNYDSGDFWCEMAYPRYDQSTAGHMWMRTCENGTAGAWSQVGSSIIGNFTATGNVTAYSDERLKSDIQTLDGKKVLQMRGVSFTKDGEAGSGVIAQELEKIAPELVHSGEEYKSVAYGNITGYLIEAVKEQQKEIDELKSLVKQLLEK